LLQSTNGTLQLEYRWFEGAFRGSPLCVAILFRPTERGYLSDLIICF
jgi:hypothetical protein